MVCTIVASLVGVPGVAHAQRLDAEIEETYTVGFDQNTVFFGRIQDIAITPDGRVVVYDGLPGDGPAVTILSAEGGLVTRWGRRGDGPGELGSGSSAKIAYVDADETVVIAGSPRRGRYTLDGREMDRWEAPPAVFLELASVSDQVYAWRAVFEVDPNSAKATMVFTLGPWDGSQIWQKRRPRVVVGGPLRASPILVSIPGGQWVVGYGDEYNLKIVSAPTGDTVSRIVRQVPKRERREVEVFHERVRHYLAHPDQAPTNWSSLIHNSDRPNRAWGIDEEPPVVADVFWGPPGVVWVQRGLGVADEFAGPLSRPDESRLWDIFELQDNRTEYHGVVALPDGYRPFAGNDEVLAGVALDEYGRSAVRVLRVRIPSVEDSSERESGDDWCNRVRLWSLVVRVLLWNGFPEAARDRRLGGGARLCPLPFAHSDASAPPMPPQRLRRLGPRHDRAVGPGPAEDTARRVSQE